MESQNKTFIYVLIDPFTNQVRYVGKADNLKNRLYNHVKSLSKKTKKISWIKSLIKKGVEPEISDIDYVLKSEWEFWEMHYISLYKSWGFKLTNGDNGGVGGCGRISRKMSDVTKEKIRQCKLNMSDEYRSKLRLANLGKKASKQQRLNQSIAHKNQTNENLRTPIVQLDKNKNFIAEHISISEASRFLTGNAKGSSNITRSLKKGTVGFGYYWEYKNQSNAINNAPPI